MNFCPNCNKSYSDEVTFCLADGTVLVPHPQEQETVFIPPRKQGSLEQTTSIRKSFYISLGIGLAAVIFGALGMSLLHSYWTTDDNSTGSRKESAPKAENTAAPVQPMIGKPDNNPNSLSENTPNLDTTGTSDRAAVRNEVRAALDGWAQTLRDHDLEKHLSYYADRLEVHRDRSNVELLDVRRFNEKLFNRYSQFELEIFDVATNVMDNGNVITTYKTNYNFRGPIKRHSGTDQRTEMRWRNINGVWKIISER